MEHVPKPFDKKDLKVAAVFISKDVGLEITLKPIETMKDNPGERDYKTGLKIKFEGGVKYIFNKAILKKMMNNSAYKKGEIRIHPEDPTGFWRAAGIIKPEIRETVISKEVPNPAFTDEFSSSLNDIKISKDIRPLILDDA